MPRPSTQALSYMWAWKSAVAGEPFDASAVPEWCLQAAVRGHSDGISDRQAKWGVAKESYPNIRRTD
jgi:hypothetical protein